jgi:hypothetical protein
MSAEIKRSILLENAGFAHGSYTRFVKLAFAASLVPASGCGHLVCAPASGEERPPRVERIGSLGGSAPALAADGNTLYVAWKEPNPGYAMSWTSFDGSAWVPPGKVDAYETGDQPALAVFGARPYIAWKGARQDQGLWYSSLDGGRWAPQREIPGRGTSAGPALAAWHGRLYLAWKGMDADTGIWWASSDDGESWTPQERVEGVATSTSPALASGNDKLYLAWKGAGPDPGIGWTSYDGTAWAPQQLVAGAKTGTSPALAAENDRLYVAWKGVTDDTAASWTSSEGEDGRFDTSIWWASFDRDAFTPPRLFRKQATIATPNIAAAHEELYAAWKGAGADRGIYLGAVDLKR